MTDFSNRATWRRAAAACAVVMPFSAVAQSTSAQIAIYGQLNLGVVYADDGVATDTVFTDNDNFPSLIGLLYSRDLVRGGKFQFHFETSLGLTGSSSLVQGEDEFDIDYQRTDIRKFEAIYVTPEIGTFSFGQGSTATDGSGVADFSGTSVIQYSTLSDLAGNREFQLLSGVGSGIRVSNVFGSFNGTRRFRARYDTPSYNGIGLALSAGEEVLNSGDDNEYYDIGLNYDQDYGDLRVAARAGYSWRGSSQELLVGSLALLHEPTGLNLALAGGSQQEGAASYGYVKAGWQQNWFSIGQTRLSIDYYAGDDFSVIGSESESVSLAVVQVVDAYDLELYAIYRTYELEGTGAEVFDQDVTFVGARWRF
jgi:hypothetical protein